MITYEELYNKQKNNNNDLLIKIGKDNNIKKYTGKQLFEKAEKIAAKFESKGLSCNDNIAIFASDSPEWVAYFLAIFKLGATAVLIEKALEKEELDNIINSIELTAICTEEELMPKIKNSVEYIFNIDDNNFIINCPEKKIVNKKNENDCAKCIIFSSGTTSTKTGVVHKTSNLYETIKYTNDRYKLSTKDTFITIVPNTHIYGLSINVIVATLIGSKVCYLESLDTKSLLFAIKSMNPTYISGVPKLYELFKMQIEMKLNKNIYKKILNIVCFLRRYTTINIGKYIFKQVFEMFGRNTTLVSAGAPLQQESKDFFWGLGFPIIEFYGSTETGVPIIGTENKNSYTIGTGKKFKQCMIRIVPETKELLVKSDYCLIGYSDKSNKIKEIMNEDNWIKTGDMAEFDKYKNVHIIGRIKENIVLENGEKVTPTDVEYYYRNIKGVKEFAIVGIPQEKNSQHDQIHIFIVKQDNVSEDEVKANLKEISKSVTLNMRIKGIHFVEEIPKTAIGKTKRYLLKKSLE